MSQELFIEFPDPREAWDDVIYIGGSLTVENVLQAYRLGIFPWPHEGLPMLWFCPRERGVLDFSELHVSRSLLKFARNTSWRLTKNRAFAEVIEGCQMAHRKGQNGTWITPKVKAVYTELSQLGVAQSVECWDGERLVGGIYGVDVNGVFSAESMFFRESNASKICLLELVRWLEGQGRTWIDVQMVTESLKSWGAKYIAREIFLDRLQVPR